MSDIGLIGLAVMGENLVMNMLSKGFSVAVYTRDTAKVDKFVNGRAKGLAVTGTHSLQELAAALTRPRKVMLMIKAGQPVDDMLDKLLDVLEPGDIVIDGGNSYFMDTQRRQTKTEARGLLYIGTGVSGGEEGALLGPSIMPGGSVAAWDNVKPIFTAIAAKAGDTTPCCKWLGGGGAGHFVKMVHNGIEYGDMQLICEAYAIMRDALGMDNAEMSAVFDEWNGGRLGSYLIEITRDILAARDDEGFVIDRILDAAGQKGTGKWTSVTALDSGVPLTLISEAVFARCLSSLKEQRVKTAAIFTKPKPAANQANALTNLKKALFASKIISYAQGFALMDAVSQQHGWSLDMGAIASVWRGGCIIRSVFLDRITESYTTASKPENLIHAPYFRQELEDAQQGWRDTLCLAIQSGIATPAMSAALAYFDGISSENLPANLLQAQRDYFGAHQFERTDKPRGETFHHNWTGRGGDTASTTYLV